MTSLVKLANRDCAIDSNEVLMKSKGVVQVLYQSRHNQLHLATNIRNIPLNFEA